MGRSFDSSCNFRAGPNVGRCNRMRSSSSSSSASANADACCAGELDIASRSAPSSKNIGFAKRRPPIVGLHQVVRLRQMLLQWRRRAANNIDRTLLQAAMSPAARAGRKLLIRRDSSSSCEPSSASSCEDHERGSGAGAWHIDDLLPAVPAAAAAGCLAIYVGREHRRYEIPVEHINHPLLQGLLKRSEGEIGLKDVLQLGGGLAIPACETVLFEHLLWMVENHESMKHLFEDPAELRELLDFYMHQHNDITAGDAPAQADQGALTLSSNSCLQEVNVFHSDVLTTYSTRVSACT